MTIDSNNNNISQLSPLNNYDPFLLRNTQGPTYPATKTLKLMQQFVTSQYVKTNDPLAITTAPSISSSQPDFMSARPTNSRVDQAAQRTLMEKDPDDEATLLASVKLQKQSLVTFQAALSNGDQSAKEQAYRALPESIKEILGYLVWHHHGCPQKMNYAEGAILENFSVLSKIQTPYLHPNGENIVEQAIYSIEDKIRLLEAKKIVGQLEKLKELCQGASDNSILLGALWELKKTVQWDLHGWLYEYAQDPQHVKGDNWGKFTLEANVRRLISTTDPSEGNRNLLEKAIENYTNEFKELLNEQTDREINHFRQLVDGNMLTHRQLHKIYKSLDPAKRTSLEQPYQPPYYGKGIHADLHTFYGSHIDTNDNSVVFRVYAPNAKDVSVAILKNGRISKTIPMQKAAAGNWELKTSDAKAGTVYEYLITTHSNGLLRKADPYARQNREVRDAIFKEQLNDNGTLQQTIETQFHHVSVVAETKFNWTDDAWMVKRAQDAHQDAPRNIYELHVSSWKRRNGEIMNWQELAVELAEYCKENKFTHVELFGVLDHILNFPYTGYQPLAFFAPNHRLGSLIDFKAFVNHMHTQGIGVFLDWIPGHFGINESGLHNFDGTALYQHHDQKRAYQKDWNVMNFDFEQKRVCDFLLSSAEFWLGECHIDGFRVDAVTNVCNSQRLPHYKGGKWHIEALNFIRDVNAFAHHQHPGVVTMAEEFQDQVASTHTPSKKFSFDGEPLMRGLGFDEKWALGWMHFMSVRFLSEKPEHKRYHRGSLFHAMKIDTSAHKIHEKTVRAFSHDETGNKKGCLLQRVQTEVAISEQSLPSKFADLRAFYAHQICLPGSKLSFMGNEFAQTEEWSDLMFLANGISDGHNRGLGYFTSSEEQKVGGVAWEQLTPGSRHEQYKKFFASLNDLYLKESALWGQNENNFQWFHTADPGAEQGRPLIAFFRKGNDHPNNQLICINNFGDNEEQEYTIMFPNLDTNPHLIDLKSIEEIFNTDDIQWGGNGKTNKDQPIELLREDNQPTGRPIGFKLRIAPQSGIILKPHFFNRIPSELSVHCPLPRGKCLFVRGSGEGLSWGKGVPLQSDGEGNWKLPLRLQSEIQCKFLLDDQEWETGNDHSLSPGATSTEAPQFSSILDSAPKKKRLTFHVSSADHLFIRGEGAPGLSWDKGTELQKLSEHVWCWETDAQDLSKLQFKLLANDQRWEKGFNRTIRPGQSLEFKVQL